MGPTKVYHAQFTAPESIRGRFGLSDTRNATHGSGELYSQFLNLPEQQRIAT
jgi:nucleoside-diphosphate kinase